MIKAICAHLRDIIATRDYAQVIGGVVRPYESKAAKGKSFTYPVDCLVLGADCTDGDYTALLPDHDKDSLFFFEEISAPRVVERDGRHHSYRATVRLNGWINMDRLGLPKLQNCEGCTHGTRIINELITLFPKNQNIGGDCKIIGLSAEVDNVQSHKYDPWERYTVKKESRYLMLPYEAFGVDLVLTWKIAPSCVESVTVGTAIGCGSSPIRKKHPKDFTCEELQHPVTGLTAEQLGPECLDCNNAGDCEGSDVTANTDLSVGTTTPGSPFDVQISDSELDLIAGLTLVGSKVVVPDVEIQANGVTIGAAPVKGPAGVTVRNTADELTGYWDEENGCWRVPVGTTEPDLYYAIAGMYR